MSGHSKWATTKRAKAVVDSKRAAVFTRAAHVITLAAREKGGNLEMNFSLRLAIEKARAVNMPKDNIERAIKRGTGELGGEQLEEITYEGYGPGGGAVLIEVLTNNRNRTGSEIRHIFSKHGGNFGAQNSVAWMFEKKGVIELKENKLSDEQELGCIETGVQDIIKQEGGITLYTLPEDLQKIKSYLEKEHINPLSTELDRISKTTISPSEQDSEKITSLFEELEEHEDVVNYYSNYT